MTRALVSTAVLVALLFAVPGTSQAQALPAPTPTFKVGDEWRYTGDVVLRVVAIEDGKVVTSLTPNPRCPDCRYYRDADLTVVSVLDKNGLPPQNAETGLQLLSFPLEVGKTWTSDVMMWTSANRYLPYSNTFKVERIVDVKTTAGVFKAYEINWRQESGDAGMSWRGQATLYYSPDVRGFVKREVHTRNWLQNTELEAFVLKD